MDDLGQPGQNESEASRTAQDAQQTESEASRTAQDAQQTISLSTQQAAQQLGVDGRTIRRYINEGIRTPSGMVRLEARQVRGNRGPEWQIYQNDLDTFKQHRDRAATEGQTAGEIIREGEASQALTLSVQFIATELERRSQALAEAQQTIERLAREAGRSEELERERDTLRQRVKELEERRSQALAETQQTIERLAREAGHSEELEKERDTLRQRVKELEERERRKEEAKAKTPRINRIRLLPLWGKEEEST